ncbi:putative glycosidase CRH2 [Kickxella alabastrina]|uniref:Glycosidase CRH2 n=1 Tax=Kickxella alabastrina TaxID=61397 RepID=A0ACC1IR52_9FUNG|nr:putative glycosidase CRH2 [Kickxella alabastrina]
MKTVLLALVFSAAVLGAKCGDQQCRKDAPCCVKGYCNINAMYCAPFSCEPDNSLSPSSCWSTPHCVDYTADFTKPAGSGAFAQIADYKGNPSTASYVSQFEPSNANLANEQLELTLTKQSDGKGFGAVVIGTRAIQYGTVTAVVRSGCRSTGVVSSLIIRNDKIGDEIDFEFVGADKLTVQSNYYWHNELDYTKMVKSSRLPDTTEAYHTYQVVWAPDSIQWLVNGNSFRTVNRADTWDAERKVFRYPDTEAFVSFSIWDGGSGPKGTSDWAGKPINWEKGPFIMGVKSIAVNCYFRGNETTYTPPV